VSHRYFEQQPSSDAIEALVEEMGAWLEVVSSARILAPLMPRRP